MAHNEDTPEQHLVNEWQKLLSIDASAPKGFSDRINFLIDCTDLKAPKLQDGRINWLMKLTGHARATVNEWLNRDSPPVREMHVLVKWLTSHLEGEYEPGRIEAWLIYGDPIVSNPVSITSYEGRKAQVKLAIQLIAEISQSRGLRHSDYDFQDVLSQTVKLLGSFKLDSWEDIQSGHRDIVYMYLIKGE